MSQTNPHQTNNQTKNTVPVEQNVLGLDINQLMQHFATTAYALQNSLVDEAKEKFCLTTVKAIDTMSPKFTVRSDTRCLMPFQRGRCVRPRNPTDPDGLCKQCRSRNNSYCMNDKESYFNYWKPNSNNDVPTPDLKVRGVHKKRGRR